MSIGRVYIFKIAVSYKTPLHDLFVIDRQLFRYQIFWTHDVLGIR